MPDKIQRIAARAERVGICRGIINRIEVLTWLSMFNSTPPEGWW